MSSPTQGMWTCRHGVDGRDHCPECFSAPEPAQQFPTSEYFEVWEMTAGDQRRVDRWHAAETAQRVAAEYNAEAEENYRAESGGPVQPVKRRFVAVRVTEIREVVR